MEPAIIFLGTGGDDYVVGKCMRTAGGIILRTAHQFHIDPGPGSLIMARQFGVNVREHIGVICTHAHTNHCNDVNAVIGAMTLNGMDVKGVVMGSESVISGGDAVHPYLTAHHRELVEKVVTLKPGQKIAVEDTEVHVLPSSHEDESAVGLKFFTPFFVLSYSGDTKYTKEIAEQYKGSDILILNVVFPSGTQKPSQLSTDDAVRIVELVKPSLAVITHFGKRMVEVDPIVEARTIQRLTGVQTIAAKDGLTLNPVSYSANMRQKTMNLY